MLSLTDKQKEYWQCANRRWNIKSGATRSGKTFLDYYLLPKRIRAVTGKSGLIVILGNTEATLRRNIIEPLQSIWGEDLVSDIKTGNTAYMFGQKVHCLGAEKISQVNKIRGASISYCYGDEVVTWHPEVFNMLKSRLDKEYSLFDGTCNPEGPNHWFKNFLDSDADIFQQTYTLYDNPHNPASFVKNLEKEYAGTVYFDRHILGRWVAAEGRIYKRFSDNPAAYEIDISELPSLQNITVGVDFGGSGSNHAFCASGFDSRDCLYALKAESIPAKDTDVLDLLKDLAIFCEAVEKLYRRIDGIYCDSAEQTIINTIRNRMPKVSVYNAKKLPINDRIRAEIVAMGSDRLKLVRGHTDALKKGLRDAVYDSKVKDADVRLDDGTSDIDILDAFEYSFEREIRRMRR